MSTQVIIFARQRANVKRLCRLCLLLVFLLPGNSSVWAQVKQGMALEVRTLYPSEWGVPYPAGLAYATTPGHLFLLDKGSTEPLPTSSTVAIITPYEDLVNYVQFEFAVDDAINMAFDDGGNSLFLLNDERAELAQVEIDENGSLNPATLVRFDITSFGLSDAQGLAVDAARQRLYVLDSGALQVLSVALNAGFAGSAVSRIDLSHLAVTDLRSLAIHPATHHLYLASQTTQQLYELTETGQWVASYALTGLDLTNAGGLVFAPSADLTDPPDTIHLFIADSGQVVNPLANATPAASEQLYLPLIAQSTENSISSPDTSDAGQTNEGWYGKIVEAALVCEQCTSTTTTPPATLPGATPTPAGTPTLADPVMLANPPIAVQSYLPLIRNSAREAGIVSPAATTSLTFAADADARVLQGNPNTNYGTSSKLSVDSPGEESYLRFTVTGVTGAVQSATLRVFATDSSSNGPAVHGTGNSWSETAITWNNRPAPTSSAVDNKGAITPNVWVEYNVTALVTGNGAYGFVFLADSTQGVTLRSRESGFPPQLVLSFTSGPTPTPTDTPTNTAVPPTSTNTPVPPTDTAVPPTSTNTPVPPTNTPVSPTPTNTLASTGVTLAAEADARVIQASSATNYGTSSKLDVDSPGVESYLRFSVSGVPGVVQSAILRLFVTNASSDAPGVYSTGNNWSETGITWNNRPAPTTGVIANLGAIAANGWAEYNVTTLVTGNGSYSFVLQPDSTDGISFSAREGSSPPQLVLSFVSGPTPTPTDTPTPGPPPTATNTPASGGVVFVGAGDIASCSRTQDEATAQLLDNIPGTVFTVGDNAYPSGTAANFNDCYHPTWGRHKARTRPAVGDNEYSTSGASGYFNYFGAAAGDPTKGYYSYNAGSWHIIVLNSNCSRVGGCGPTSVQGQWLQADLAANPTTCTLAIFHEPLFSSNNGDSDMRDFWVPLYAAGAEIVLSGHRHMYERFAQQNPNGVADPGRGIRAFVVGTGGASLSSFGTIASNSEVRNNTTYGVLKFTLHPTSYTWEFIPISGQTFTDSGSTPCVTP